MNVPTCRNPDCAEKDVRKPVFLPPPEATPTVTGLIQSPFDISTITWFCGTCGAECELVVEADEDGA